MSENAQITLEEAKNLYNSSEEAKVFLLSKFTKEELEGKNIPTQEEFNKFFEENILSQIDYSKTKFLDSNAQVSKTPTSTIELRNSDNMWLFDYNYDQKNPYFYYSHYRVYSNFQKQFSLQDVDRHRLMKSLVEKHFNLGNTQPFASVINSVLSVEKHFNLGNTQPDLATILNK